MEYSLFKLMSPLLILFTIMVAFYTYLLIKVPQKYMFKWIGIPLLLIGSYFSYTAYEQSLGFAVPIIPDGQFIYIAHRVISKVEVELWIIEANGKSRVYLIPRSALLEQKLDKAKERASLGIVQLGRLKGKRGNGEWKWDDSEFGDIPMDRMYPK